MKTSRFLSELLIEDLAKYTGLRFPHPDRLSRDEAQAIRNWAATTPEIARMLSDKSHVDHKHAMLFHDLIKHYLYDHPQNASGAPQAWPERQNRPPAIEGQPFSDLFPDEARALHAWAQASPEYNAIYFDGSHPQHKAVVARTSALLERASLAEESSSEGTEMRPPPPGATPAASPPPTNDLAPAAALAQIKALKADPAFMKAYQSTIRSGPEFQLHKDALARMSKLYEQAYPPAPQAPAASGQGAPAPAPRSTPAAVAAPASASALQQIAAKRADPVFMANYSSKTYATRIAAMDEMANLYAAAYPTAAPASEAATAPSEAKP